MAKADNGARSVYRAGEETRWQPRKDWVELSGGKWICVWELSVAETLRLSEFSQRHPDDPRPGNNQSEAALWLLAFSCHGGDEPDAPRIWDDIQIGLILELPPRDFNLLIAAASDKVGVTEEVAQARADFTRPPRDGGLPPSPRGVSKTSIGSLVS